VIDRERHRHSCARHDQAQTRGEAPIEQEHFVRQIAELTPVVLTVRDFRAGHHTLRRGAAHLNW
jgi:hypothetical protein